MMIRTVLAAVMTQWISLGQTIPFETHYEFGSHIPGRAVKYGFVKRPKEFSYLPGSKAILRCMPGFRVRWQRVIM